MKNTVPKQDKQGKVPEEIINSGRRQAMAKLVYTPPTLITLGLINQSSAQETLPSCPPGTPSGTPGCP